MPGVLATTINLRWWDFVYVDISNIVDPGESVRVSLWVPSMVSNTDRVDPFPVIGVRVHQSSALPDDLRGTIEALASGMLTVEFPPNWPGAGGLLLWSFGPPGDYPLPASLVVVVSPSRSNRLRVSWSGFLGPPPTGYSSVFINQSLFTLAGTVTAYYGGDIGGTVDVRLHIFGMPPYVESPIINQTTTTSPAGPWSASVVMPLLSDLVARWTSKYTLLAVDLIGG